MNSWPKKLHKWVARTSCMNELHERVSRASCMNKLHKRVARKKVVWSSAKLHESTYFKYIPHQLNFLTRSPEYIDVDWRTKCHRPEIHFLSQLFFRNYTIKETKHNIFRRSFWSSLMSKKKKATETFKRARRIWIILCRTLNLVRNLGKFI